MITKICNRNNTRSVQKVLQLDHKEEWKCYKLHFIFQYNHHWVQCICDIFLADVNSTKIEFFCLSSLQPLLDSLLERFIVRIADNAGHHGGETSDCRTENSQGAWSGLYAGWSNCMQPQSRTSACCAIMDLWIGALSCNSQLTPRVSIPRRFSMMASRSCSFNSRLAYYCPFIVVLGGQDLGKTRRLSTIFVHNYREPEVVVTYLDMTKWLYWLC